MGLDRLVEAQLTFQVNFCLASTQVTHRYVYDLLRTRHQLRCIDAELFASQDGRRGAIEKKVVLAGTIHLCTGGHKVAANVMRMWNIMRTCKGSNATKNT